MSQGYTLCEIAQHNGQNGNGVWLVIKGVVYDVTAFIKDHPGGEELVLEYAGKDATKAFNEVGHSADAIKELKTHKIGIVANENSGCNNASTTVSTEVLTASTKHQQNAQCDSTPEKKRTGIFCCC